MTVLTHHIRFGDNLIDGLEHQNGSHYECGVACRPQGIRRHDGLAVTFTCTDVAEPLSRLFGAQQILSIKSRSSTVAHREGRTRSLQITGPIYLSM